MKADSLKVSRVFSGGGDIHYVLPHFQREYVWGGKESGRLCSTTVSQFTTNTKTAR
jgi:hypothetical protein